tara:strand:- start:7919 stop:8128 length:210 start_codon:yes stop_codon:yes gene_type:complete
MVVCRVEMFLGFDEAPDGWALRRVENLCGLTLGGGIEGDEAGTEAGPDARQTSGNRPGLRLISGGRAHG